MTHPLAILVIGKDSPAIEGFMRHHETTPSASIGRIIPIINDLGTPLACLANSALELVTEEVFGLLHADVYFDSPLARLAGQQWEPDLSILYRTAMDGAVCGIVGADLTDVRYRWGNGLKEPWPVSCLDGCSLFMRRNIGLRFDSATFNGFHCHVEDLCLQAHQRGVPVIVPPVKAEHKGESTFEPKWQAQYFWYRKKLEEKWARLAPEMRWQTT